MALHFRHVLTDSGKLTNVCLVRRPVSEAEFSKQSRKYLMYGLCSYTDFPKGYWNLASRCYGWMHGFRDPDLYLPPVVPRLMLSSSDFTDPDLFQAHSVCRAWRAAYCVLKYQTRYKNLDLFCNCLPTLIGDLKMDVIVLGTYPSTPVGFAKWMSKTIVTGVVSQTQLGKILASSAFLFVPNQFDSSPRVLTEALCTNTPVIVNKHILGGWKYVNSYTGAFFSDVSDVANAVHSVVRNKLLSPRAWFCERFGPEKSGRRLYQFVRSLTPSATKAKYYKLAPVGWTPK